jgi:hypothetical protein
MEKYYGTMPRGSTRYTYIRRQSRAIFTINIPSCTILSGRKTQNLRQHSKECVLRGWKVQDYHRGFYRHELVHHNKRYPFLWKTMLEIVVTSWRLRKKTTFSLYIRRNTCKVEWLHVHPMDIYLAFLKLFNMHWFILYSRRYLILFLFLR